LTAGAATAGEDTDPEVSSIDQKVTKPEIRDEIYEMQNGLLEIDVEWLTLLTSTYVTSGIADTISNTTKSARTTGMCPLKLIIKALEI
jgi:hypothetical protein